MARGYKVGKAAMAVHMFKTETITTKKTRAFRVGLLFHTSRFLKARSSLRNPSTSNALNKLRQVSHSLKNKLIVIL